MKKYVLGRCENIFFITVFSPSCVNNITLKHPIALL